MTRGQFMASLGAGVVAGLALPNVVRSSAAEPAVVAQTPLKPWKDYRCLYNIEMLVLCYDANISSARAQAMVLKLAETDVDAVMCCPTAWRTNVYPSEVDPEWKRFIGIRKLPKFPSFDHVMKFIHGGGDPVRDMLEASRKTGKGFFVSYRMNDLHHIEDKSFPTHNAFWREHPEYWLGDSNRTAYGAEDNRRLFNYMLDPVRDHYFAILEELATNYDIDGIELDFQRCSRFFHDDEIEAGKPVMTAFVRRVRQMLDRVGRGRGRALHLCVRVLPSVEDCLRVGLEVTAWDAERLVDMINVAPAFVHTTGLRIEQFKAQAPNSRVYGELNYLTAYADLPSGRHIRFTTFEIYRSSALSFLARGADGVSVFNFDHVPGNVRSAADMAKGLKGIANREFLRMASKNYLANGSAIPAKTFPAAESTAVDLFVADDTSQVPFGRAVLRVEIKERSKELDMAVSLNGTPLETYPAKDTELFPPVQRNPACPPKESLQFFNVPPELLIFGNNRFEIRGLGRLLGSFTILSLELALYRDSTPGGGTAGSPEPDGRPPL